MNNLTGIILTHNNEPTIARSVQSIKPLVSELIIIDDLSTDQTLDIIKKEYPAVRIFHKKLLRFDEQRNYGISLASNDWILMIDSDEIVNPELVAAIRSIDLTADIDGYWAVRMKKFFSVYLKETVPERPILFKGFLRFINPVHEVVIIDRNKVGRLSGWLMHEDWLGVSANMSKMNAYSSLLAKKWLEQNRNYNDFQLLIFATFFPVVCFFDYLFKKRFYKAGLNGLLYAALLSADWLVVILKYRELKRRN